MKTQKIAICFCAVFILCLPGCGVIESEQDRLVREFSEKMGELGTVYESIKDEKSARTAAVQIEVLASELSQIKSELYEIPVVSDQEAQRVFDKIMESTQKAREQTQKLTELFQKKPELVLILAPALDTLQSAIKSRRRR